MSLFALIFLIFLTNQTEENKTLKTPFEIFKKLRACLVSVSKNCFLFLKIKDTKKHVWQLFPMFLNLFSVFLIWWFWRTISSCFSCFLHCEWKKKNTREEQKNHWEQITNLQKMYPTTNFFQIPNPHIENKPTSPQICALKIFFSNFLLQMRKSIGYSVGNGGNAAIWNSHGQWRWVNICVHERDKRIGEMEVLRWKRKRGVWIMWNERERL